MRKTDAHRSLALYSLAAAILSVVLPACSVNVHSRAAHLSHVRHSPKRSIAGTMMAAFASPTSAIAIRRSARLFMIKRLSRGPGVRSQEPGVRMRPGPIR